MHNHKHDHCKHLNLAHCENCDVTYCKDCSKEWGQQVYNWYPYTLYNGNFNYDYPYCNATTTIGSYNANQPITCYHNQ